MARRFNPGRASGEYYSPYEKKEAGHTAETRLLGILSHFGEQARPASNLEDDTQGFDFTLADGTRVQLKTYNFEMSDKERLAYLGRGVVPVHFFPQELTRAARPNGQVPPDREIEAWTAYHKFRQQVEPFKKLALQVLRERRRSVNPTDFQKAKQAMQNFEAPPPHPDVPEQRVFSPEE